MLTFFLSASSSVQAANFFVSPTAGTNGDGSVANPWSLETALYTNAPVNPGDTVWLRGGNYVPSQSQYPAFESYLRGSTNAPIIVRSYPGEHVILREHPQYTGSDDRTILYIYGSNTWFWGLEVASLSTTRVIDTNNVPNSSNPPVSKLPLPSGVQVRGGNIKLINLIIHDTRGGLGLWQEAVNCETYGCLIYNNGWLELPHGGHGHGAYCQNSNGVMRLSNNIIFNQFANGIQGYTSGSQVRNLYVDANAVFGNARIANYPVNDTGEQLVFGGGARIENLKILNNYIFQNLSMNGVVIRTDVNGTANSNVTFAGNYVAAGSGGGNFQVTSTHYDALIFTNNTLYSTNGNLLAIQSMAGYNINSNTYYGNGGQGFNNNGTSYSFANWKSATGLDPQSSYVANGLPPDRVFVNRNAYEPGRANIIVYNWSSANNVAVDVSSVLSSGDVYEVRNAQDFFAPPILTGTYFGTSLSLPMTNLTTVAPNGWTNTAAVPTTGKQFNVFVLTSVPSSIPPQSFPLNPYVQVLDGQWQGTKFASDGSCYFASSTHDNKHGAAFFRYQPDIKVLTMLTNDITRVCGEDPTVTPPQGKIHSDILEHNGWLYFATHLGNYWLEAQTNYTGAHVIGYELATGNFRDFGVIRSNHTIYAGIGLDPVRNKLIVYTTRDWGSSPGSYMYRIDITTGTKELLGAAPGIAAFWFFVDSQGDCWISPQADNGSLLRVRSATGQIDRWDNVQPADELQGDRFWAWAQPLPDGDRCVFRLQDGNNLYTFDASRFRTNSATGFSVVQNIGPYGLGMALGQDRVFYIQRANRQDGQQGYQDFHLLSASLASNATPAILDHGLIVDQSGRLAWRIPGMAADPQNRIYMVGDWWLLPGEQGSTTGTFRHVDGPGTNYTAEVRGEFFAVTKVSISSPPPPPPLSSNGYSQAVTSANPVAYWRLNETNGATVAADLLGSNNGTINAGVIAGVSGPQSPPFLGFETNNTAMQFNYTANSFLTMPVLNLNTSTVTITGWINPTGFQASWAGIVFCRSNSTVAGLNFGPGSIPNELRYHWNDSQWDTSTGLVVPTNQWSFVALVVTPTNATIYLGTNGMLNSFTNAVNHPNEAFDGSLRIGSDSHDGLRLFKGKLDEIALFNRSLTPTQIQQLYAAALTAPPVPLTPFQTWQFQYFGCTNCTESTAAADPDGDGQNNEAEFLAGMNPTNAASAFRVTSVAPEGNGIRVTWMTAGGRTNALQIAESIEATYSNAPPIVISGLGVTTTNYLDENAALLPSRYYRVRLVP